MAVSNVTRCICHDRTFEEIREYAEERDFSTVEELQNDKYCSCSCRLCVPYVKAALESGQTQFEPGEPYRKKRDRRDL